MEEVTQGFCGQDGCLETRYILENGIWFCRRGHQQAGRQVIVDDDEFGSQGRVIRKKKDVSQKMSRKYQGRQAYQLYLEAYQLVLWKQCYALIHDKGLPMELEALVKELWALRLQVLSEREGDNYLSDDNTTQAFSSQAGSSADENDGKRRHEKKFTDSPKMVESISLCYLGLLLLRIPMSIGYLHRWALLDEVPLIRAIRHIPRVMKDRLPPTYLQALDTEAVPGAAQIHHSVTNLVVLYSQKFSMSFPPINVPLIQFMFVRELALPLEIYFAMNALRDSLHLNFSFASSTGKRKSQLDIPEIKLISLLVVAVKIIFPFDEVKRYSYSTLDPAAQSIDWNTWVKLFRKQRENRVNKKLNPEKAIAVTEGDILNMDNQQLDDYMDWYEKMWISDKDSNLLADMFQPARTHIPLAEQTNASENIKNPDESPNNAENIISNRLHAVIETLTICPTVPPSNSNSEHTQVENVLRPGAHYQRYKTQDHLPENARIFYEEVAQLVGLSLNTLLMTVWKMEDMIERMERQQRSS